MMVVVILAACGGAPAPQPQPVSVKRTITARTALPKSIVPLVPQHGIFAAGGARGSAWRVVVDTDANTLYAGSAHGPDAAAFGPMEREATNPLTAPNKQYLTKLADDAWHEPAPAVRPENVEGSDEILIVADGDDTFFLRGNGPIRRPLAAKAIEQLRAAGAL